MIVLHTYIYNKDHGIKGSQELTELFLKNPSLHLDEDVYTVSKTNADGEYVAEKSRDIPVTNRLTSQELIDIANTRYNGSTIFDNINQIDGLYPKLKWKAQEWNNDKFTGADSIYNTFHPSDAGPREFQTAQQTLKIGIGIKSNIDEMLDVIEVTQEKVPILQNKIQEFIEIGYIKYVSSEKEAKKLEKEIMMITKHVYSTNFKKGVNVDRFRIGLVFLYILMGLILGGAFGIAINHIGDKTEIYKKTGIYRN